MKIPRDAIDDSAARGLRRSTLNRQARGFDVLLTCKPLLVLAASLTFFHLGNAAMLPLYGLAVVAARQANPATFVALTIVVAQATMVATAVIAMRMSESKGSWLVVPISFVALPVRCLIATYLITSWGVILYRFWTAWGLDCRVWQSPDWWRGSSTGLDASMSVSVQS